MRGAKDEKSCGGNQLEREDSSFCANINFARVRGRGNLPSIFVRIFPTRTEGVPKTTLQAFSRPQISQK